MRHYLLQPLWACHNNCSYCWVEQAIRPRPALYNATPRPLEDWVRAIQRDKPDLVDIAGGEPLLTGWIPELIAACPDTPFALSTNGLHRSEVDRLCRRRLPNLININVSYHPEAVNRWQSYRYIWQGALLALSQAGYQASASVVCHADNERQAGPVLAWLRGLGETCVLSPYERVDDLGEMCEQGLTCQGGVNHLTLGPDGTAWPCLTALRSPYYAEYALGNWLDGTLDLSHKPVPCHLKCTDYYVLPSQHPAGDMWGIEAKPCAC